MIDMKGIRPLRRLALAVLIVSSLQALPAQALTLDGDSALQHSTLVSGSYSGVETFSVTRAGLLTIRLENISWPEKLAQLNCAIYSQSGFMHSLTDSAELRFEIAGAGTYFANISAGAAGLLKLGLFSFKVSFEPSAPTVPVPAAIWLFASALALFGLRRHAWATIRFRFGGPQFA
jgi:hypothetical protein